MTSRTAPAPAAPPAPSRVPLLPAAAFVLVWSSGYIAGPAGVDAIEPFWVLVLRFAVAAALMWPLARWRRGPLRLGPGDLRRITASGLVMNALLFGLMYLAFDRGLQATMGSLLHSLSPVLTALLAGLLLGERLSARQVLGFVVGVAGVLVVLGPEVDQAGGAVGLGLGIASLFSLSFGTLGQRWIGTGIDPLWSTTLQCAVCVPPLVVLAAITEGTPTIEDPAAAVSAVLWLAVINSLLGLLLLGVLVRQGGAGASASVFFMMPPVTAVLAYVVLGDTLGVREVVGLVLSMLGVAAATRRTR